MATMAFLLSFWVILLKVIWYLDNHYDFINILNFKKGSAYASENRNCTGHYRLVAGLFNFFKALVIVYILLFINSYILGFNYALQIAYNLIYLNKYLCSFDMVAKNLSFIVNLGLVRAKWCIVGKCRQVQIL